MYLEVMAVFVMIFVVAVALAKYDVFRNKETRINWREYNKDSDES